MAKLPDNAVHPQSRAKWRTWLSRNHDHSIGVFLVTFKKHTGLPDLSYDDAVEEALCFGWVDSRPQKLDEDRTMLWFSPRKPGSSWAKSNKLRVAKLIEAGLMHEAGLAKVEAAKRGGTWTKLDGVEELAVPLDLAKAFTKAARKYWDQFPPGVRRSILEWIVQAKKPETRARRIEETARLAALNQRANQWRDSHGVTS